MKSKYLVLLPILSVLVGCGDLQDQSDGPRNDELISNALNEVNFLNYSVQAKHHNLELGDFYTVATITPLDLSFKTKKTQLLYTTEHSYYYFDRIDDTYDVYYKDKLHTNRLYLGNSYYGRYNRTDIIEKIPTLDDMYNYYEVHGIQHLKAEDFTYNKNLNGWYILNENAYSRVISEFFNYDQTYNITKFDLQVSKNKVNSIIYEITTQSQETISNELFYTYPVDYLQESQFSLINTVSVEKVAMNSINLQSEEIVSSDITSEDPSLENGSSEEVFTSEDILTSEIPSSNDDPISETPATSEDPSIVYVDKINFSIYDDASIFGSNRYTIASIQLFENYDYLTGSTIPLYQLDKGDDDTVKARTFTINRRLKRGSRYLLRINIGSSPNGVSYDYYDYSFIY